MSSGFKHIAQPGESRWEQISEQPTTLWLWTKDLAKNTLEKRYWQFALWARVVNESVQEFEIRSKWGVASLPKRDDDVCKHVRFATLDEATQWLNGATVRAMNEGYRLDG